MNKKKILISVLVLMVLAALVYLQVRTWRRFDWHRFWAATQHTQKLYLLAGVGLLSAGATLEDHVASCLQYQSLPVAAAYHNRVHRVGPVRTPRRIHTSFPDCAPRKSDHGVSGGSVDRRAHL